MAKKAMINKQQATPKYSTRAYNRCKICGRPHAYLRKFGVCRICFRELAHEVRFRELRRLVGKRRLTRMQITDTIADLLTRIRNASTAKHATVDVPASNMKKSITQILVDEGYVKDFKIIEDGKQGIIRITLKYDENRNPVITGLRRVSKPGLRIYASCEDMPKVIKGLGIAIVSTSKGVITDKKARELNVGGEVLAFIW